jgi:hypothetical protein
MEGSAVREHLENHWRVALGGDTLEIIWSGHAGGDFGRGIIAWETPV